MPLDASRLSDSPYSPGINEDAGETWVPFVAYVETQLPTTLTKRGEGVRYLEKKALRIEDDLRAGTTIRVVGPIAFRPNFAQKVASYTINGHYRRPTNTNPQPVANPAIIHSGTDVGEKTAQITRPGNYNPAVTAPTSALETEVDDFMDTLDGLTTEFTRANIYYVHYNSVRFGRGFKHFKP